MMSRFFLTFFFVVLSFNAFADFKWPNFSHIEEEGYCSLKNLNMPGDEDLKTSYYNGKKYIFTLISNSFLDFFKKLRDEYSEAELKFVNYYAPQKAHYVYDMEIFATGLCAQIQVEICDEDVD
jgi:hypothetical protein